LSYILKLVIDDHQGGPDQGFLSPNAPVRRTGK